LSRRRAREGFYGRLLVWNAPQLKSMERGWMAFVVSREKVPVWGKVCRTADRPPPPNSVAGNLNWIGRLGGRPRPAESSQNGFCLFDSKMKEVTRDHLVASGLLRNWPRNGETTLGAPLRKAAPTLFLVGRGDTSSFTGSACFAGEALRPGDARPSDFSRVWPDTMASHRKRAALSRKHTLFPGCIFSQTRKRA